MPVIFEEEAELMGRFNSMLRYLIGYALLFVQPKYVSLECAVIRPTCKGPPADFGRGSSGSLNGLGMTTDRPIRPQYSRTTRSNTICFLVASIAVRTTSLHDAMGPTFAVILLISLFSRQRGRQEMNSSPQKSI